MSSSSTRSEQRHPPPWPDEQPLLRLPLLGVLVGTAVLMIGLMSLYLVMRTVGLDYGGACASGGPYEIRRGQECEAGVFASAYVSIAVMVAGALPLLWGSKRYGGGRVANAAIGTLSTVFFGAFGLSFLKVAADMPIGADGISDFKGVGVALVVMAVLGLGLTLAVLRYGDRIGRTDNPKPPSRAWLAWLGAVATGLAIGTMVGALIVRAA